MAKGASNCLYLFLLSVLTVSSSGTLVGFFYDARKSNAISSAIETISLLNLNKIPSSRIRIFVADHTVLCSFSNSTSVPIDLYLNETQVENLRNYKPSAISWLKTHLNLKNIIVSHSSYELPLLLSTLKSIHSILGSFRLDREVKVSATLSLSFLESFDRKQERDLHRIFDFISKARSFITIEANIDGELSMGDQFVESVIKQATSAASVLPCNDVSMVLNIKSSAVPSAKEVNEFNGKISRCFKNSSQIIGKKIIELFAEISWKKEVEREEEQMFHSSHRELNSFRYETTRHDSIAAPATIFPTTPITNPAITPVTVPQDNPAPTIVTVPSTNPVTLTPSPIYGTPVTVPSSTPIPVVDSPVPTTPGAVPGAQPITNPVTTFPAPSGGVPITNPVTSPAVPGQSWCVAKSDALETALQSALDYACGIGGADCSTIQQGGSCYDPNSLQNHASCAFNSYFQKNPVQSSCDFGGTAIVTNINPSTGSCTYSSSSLPMTLSPTPTTASSSGAAVSGSGSPPSVLNTNNPTAGTTTVFGESPPIFNTTTTSISTGLQPFIGCIILVTSVFTGKFVLEM